MTGLFKYFRGHVSGGATCSCEDMKGFIVHNSREAEISNKQVSIILRGAEKEVLGFQVAVDDAVVVEVGYSGESGANQVCRVRLVITPFPTYSIEELSTQG